MLGDPVLLLAKIILAVITLRVLYSATIVYTAYFDFDSALLSFEADADMHPKLFDARHGEDK